tara:strand:+ start:3874 stop:4350 length:477 start_codon:yes stop_codon:yes gene_type:complete
MIIGYIQKINSDNKTAIVQAEGVIYHDVNLIYIGSVFSKRLEDNIVMLFPVNESRDNVVGIIGSKQSIDELKNNEVIIKILNSFIKISEDLTIKHNDSSIIIKKNGDIEIKGGQIKIGGGAAFALSVNSSMQISIANGSSAGVYPVQINDAGQSNLLI